ncbi:T9SS type A sorting domain-containing protein [Hymenobacter sp. YC55]|uniref:T9SS type A sorting domain-containing protein n=1 Tax=Hymenobacter sp. YC55 TaxID=3034019 RepID=UPI0023F75CDB|nr:T9SS type A sorting domain-containing protein [Hymenobacter sp. YC55]MDF7813696.1 T9SS type A sorting domain-containing protein [Hymenobacter sp. YC55]
MRATLLALVTASLGLFTSTTTSAQAISNGTFETWVSRRGLEVPFSWTTVDEGIESSPAGGFYNTVTASKDGSSHAGTYAAKLETKSDPLFSTLFGPVPGGLLLGTADFNSVTDVLADRDISGVGGLPFTTRAANMQFYYKLTGNNALPDSAYAIVALTRTTGGTTQTIASGSLRLLPAAAYTLASVPLQYTSALTPDSIHIAFASGLADTRTAGTTLFVDDVVMTGIVSATKNPALEAALTVYPNPSSNSEFRLTSPTKPTVATAPYTITDATGHVVRTSAAAPASLANGRPLELRGLPAGVYMLQLNTSEGLLTRKLLIP